MRFSTVNANLVAEHVRGNYAQGDAGRIANIIKRNLAFGINRKAPLQILFLLRPWSLLDPNISVIQRVVTRGLCENCFQGRIQVLTNRRCINESSKKTMYSNNSINPDEK